MHLSVSDRASQGVCVRCLYHDAGSRGLLGEEMPHDGHSHLQWHQHRAQQPKWWHLRKKMIMEGQNTGQLCRDRGKKNKYVRTNYVNTKVREYGGKELLQMIPLTPIPAAHRWSHTGTHGHAWRNFGLRRAYVGTDLSQRTASCREDTHWITVKVWGRRNSGEELLWTDKKPPISYIPCDAWRQGGV